MELTSDQRRYLRGLAHHINPVVMIGNSGLTEAVIREVAINLDAHELIKIRVLGDDRALREQFLQQICTELSAQAVQHIGKLLIIYRQAEAASNRNITLPKDGKSGKAPASAAKPNVGREPGKAAAKSKAR